MGKLLLITGGSGSGKSEYAEQRVLEEKQENNIYVATMMVYGEEGKERVKKHRKMREGKGFETIEQTRDLKAILPVLASYHGNVCVLIECLSNLVANELFAEEQLWKEEGKVRELQEQIIQDILEIREHTACLVIVTNEIFSDGIRYDDSTVCYQKLLGELNQRLAQVADETAEIVYGILCTRMISKY